MANFILASKTFEAKLNTNDELYSQSKLIELIPEKLLNPPKSIAHFMFGTEKKELLNSILKDTDLNFTKWAIRELMNWKNQSHLPNLIKIGGTKDKLLQPKGENTILVDKGEHFMIVDRAKEISNIINEEIKKCL